MSIPTSATDDDDDESSSDDPDELALTGNAAVIEHGVLTPTTTERRRPAGRRGPRPQLRTDPGAVRGEHAHPRRWGARARRAQRGGQDHPAVGDRRTDRCPVRAHRVPRRRPHGRAGRPARQAGHHADGRRALHVPDTDGAGEPVDGRLSVPPHGRAGPRAARGGARGVPAARQPARPERGHAVGRGAADGRPRSGADGGPGPAARRRAVARVGAQGRASSCCGWCDRSATSAPR